MYSIGCLHHTGDLPKSVDEVHRVLKPGGCAVVMLYNRRSLRRVALAAGKRLKGKSKEQVEQEFRAIYDAAGGEGAPHTDFTSRREAKRLFAKFGRVKIDVQNFDGFRWGLERDYFLGNLARLVGLDLYIVAYKKR